MAEGIILSCGNDAATTHEEIMRMYDEDCGSDMYRYRQWVNAVRDDTPIEYWDYIDTSMNAFIKMEEEYEKESE